MIFEAPKVIAALVALGVPEQFVQAMDWDVFCPPEKEGIKWVEKELGADVNQVLFGQGWQYEDEAFDCDNYALLSMSIAQMSWKKTKGHPPAGLAFGLFAFASQAHALCVCCFDKNDDGKAISVRFFEPQPSVQGQSALALTCLNENQLTREDCASCLACWFC